MSELTYPATPKFYVEMPLESEFPVEVMTTESGREQRIVHGPEQIVYEISYPLLSNTDAATILSFYRQHLGTGDSFYFGAREPSGTVTKRVRFDDFKLKHVHNGWECSARLRVVVS